MLLNGRPNWDDWLMAICMVVAQRSCDAETQHGCVIVDEEHTILSVGYNSPPRGCQDDLIPKVRPQKYSFMSHAEENAIANAARNGGGLRGGIAYVTGMPCERCFRSLINAGIKEIVYGPVSSACVSQETKDAISLMMVGRQNFILRPWAGNESHGAAECGYDILETALDYLQRKTP